MRILKGNVQNNSDDRIEEREPKEAALSRSPGFRRIGVSPPEEPDNRKRNEDKRERRYPRVGSVILCHLPQGSFIIKVFSSYRLLASAIRTEKHRVIY